MGGVVARSDAKSRGSGSSGAAGDRSDEEPRAGAGVDRRSVVMRVRRGAGVVGTAGVSRWRGEQMSQSSVGKPWMHSSVTTGEGPSVPVWGWSGTVSNRTS